MSTSPRRHSLPAIPRSGRPRRAVRRCGGVVVSSPERAYQRVTASFEPCPSPRRENGGDRGAVGDVIGQLGEQGQCPDTGQAPPDDPEVESSDGQTRECTDGHRPLIGQRAGQHQRPSRRHRKVRYHRRGQQPGTSSFGTEQQRPGRPHRLERVPTGEQCVRRGRRPTDHGRHQPGRQPVRNPASGLARACPPCACPDPVLLDRSAQRDLPAPQPVPGATLGAGERAGI